MCTLAQIHNPLIKLGWTGYKSRATCLITSPGLNCPVCCSLCSSPCVNDISKWAEKLGWIESPCNLRVVGAFKCSRLMVPDEIWSRSRNNSSSSHRKVHFALLPPIIEAENDWVSVSLQISLKRTTERKWCLWLNYTSQKKAYSISKSVMEGYY